ncbi:hypothetical protein Q1695_012569 [Nippostrongylus brasiliensis]|nr:hypothetical protein Q1695_012569 [Nippostrongylus brasiliensis]
MEKVLLPSLNEERFFAHLKMMHCVRPTPRDNFSILMLFTAEQQSATKLANSRLKLRSLQTLRYGSGSVALSAEKKRTDESCRDGGQRRANLQAWRDSSQLRPILLQVSPQGSTKPGYPPPNNWTKRPPEGTSDANREL